MTTRYQSELDGKQALARRDALEHTFVSLLPGKLQPHASGILTRMTGLAPSHRAGVPVWRDSALREATFMFVAFTVGAIFVLQPGHIIFRLIGVLMVVSSMRNLSSGAGHQLSHDPAKLLALPTQPSGLGPNSPDFARERRIEISRRLTLLGYDSMSSLVVLPTLAAYWEAHWRHHVNVAGAKDPDTRFLAYLGFYVGGLIALTRTILNPFIHLKFLTVRLTALKNGPAWRWVLALSSFGAPWFISVGSGLAWVLTLTVGYQIAALVAFTTLHHWDPTIEGKPVDVASEITLGRLVLPEPTFIGLAELALGSTLAAVCWPVDKSHDLHHLALEGGRWYSVQYVRTRLILEGRSLRQTGSTTAMFKTAFEAAKRTGMGRHSVLDEDDFLAM